VCVTEVPFGPYASWHVSPRVIIVRNLQITCFGRVPYLSDLPATSATCLLKNSEHYVSLIPHPLPLYRGVIYNLLWTFHLSCSARQHPEFSDLEAKLYYSCQRSKFLQLHCLRLSICCFRRMSKQLLPLLQTEIFIMPKCSWWSLILVN